MKKVENRQAFMTEEEVINALARSKNELPKALASSKETPLVMGNLSIDCYVLDDEKGTAVLSMRGMGKIFGLGDSDGHRFERFFNKCKKEIDFPPAIIEEIDNPLKFNSKTLTGLESTVCGIKATTLIKICVCILNVKSARIITPTIYAIADSIIKAAAETGIIAMVYEATGYEKMKKKNAYMRFFNSVLFDEARKWEKFFDDNGFLKDLAIMKGVAWAKPGCYPLYFGKLINDLVYSRIAPDMMVELGKRNPKINNYRRYKHHQFFKEGGETLVKKHLDTLHILAKASGYNWNIFMGLVENVLPVQPQSGIDDIPEDFFKSLE